MATTPDVDELLLPLAFALHRAPGSYALIAGAGLSIGAVPAAWKVLTELIGQTAVAVRETAPDAESAEHWYTERFDEEASYQNVLERISKQPQGRQRALNHFFAPPGRVIEPTPAHHAIAQLVKTGALRVLVTTNFDHLFEDALHTAGVTPTVVATDADAASLDPLHRIDCLVVHLHGSYREPDSLRNTTTELAKYGPPMRRLLRAIIRDHGLILAGWSADYDPALRRAIKRHHTHRWTPFWINPGSPSAHAQQIITRLTAATVVAGAGDAFTHLTDATNALTRRDARHHPDTPAVAAQIAKQQLTQHTMPIDLHDRLSAALTELDTLPDFHLASYDPDRITDGADGLRQRIEQATQLPAALIAVLAAWGAPATDNWWLGDVIDRFTREIPGRDHLKQRQCRHIAGSHLLYAAGVAALTADRWDLAVELLAAKALNPITNQRTDRLARICGAQTVYESTARGEHRHLLQLRPVLLDALGTTPSRLDTAWDLFEILRAASLVMDHPELDEKAGNYRDHRDTYDESQRPGGEHISEKSAFEDLDRSIGELGDLVGPSDPWAPHVYLVKELTMVHPSRPEEWTSPAIAALRTAIADDPQHPLITTGSFTVDRLDAALIGVNTHLRRQAQKSPDHGSIRDMWLDEQRLSPH